MSAKFERAFFLAFALDPLALNSLGLHPLLAVVEIS
jgi:hypothetical protein